jgi:hypothetical protein
MNKTEAEIKADKELAQYLILKSTEEYKTVHQEVVEKLKDKKRLPQLDEAKKNKNLMQATASLLVNMVQFTMKDEG